MFGPKHEVYIAMELTKMHERHYRDEVRRIFAKLEEEYEGSRIKGEITIVVGPVPKEEPEFDPEEEIKDFNNFNDLILKKMNKKDNMP